jgi:hypothetical protein
MPSIMSKIPDVIFVLGGPGSGKGTVCTKLSNVSHVKHACDFQLDILIFYLTIEVQVCTFIGWRFTSRRAR